MFYVYILQLNNSWLYTGYTTNLKHRFNQHNNGAVKSTKNLRPLKLVHYEAYSLKTDAMRREKFLKTSDGKKFLNQQLSEFLKSIGRYKNI